MPTIEPGRYRTGLSRAARRSVVGVDGPVRTPWTPEPPPQRVVSVMMDGAAVARPFSYLVPAELASAVRVGSMVRVNLGPRRDSGWVVAEVDPGEASDPKHSLRELSAVVSWGPPESVVELTRWMAWRWAGRWAVTLRAASPDRRVADLPAPRAGRPAAAVPLSLGAGVLDGVVDSVWSHAVASGVATLRLPPAGRTVDVVAALCRRAAATTLVVVPLSRQVARLASELGPGAARLPDEWARVRAGSCAVVVGSRSAVVAPIPDGQLRAIVVVAENDEALQETRSPTWHAREVAIERARRAGVPCVLVSAAPSVEAWLAGPVVSLPEREQRGGWPWVDIIDLREADPAKGRFPDEAVRALRGPGRAAVVAQLTGRLRALVCRSCGEVARCESCHSAVGLDSDRLTCSRCGSSRGAFCATCGSVALRPWRVGVSRLAEELSKVLGEPIGEFVAGQTNVPTNRVVVGTEALLNGAWRNVGRVVLLDFDHVLLAPTARAGERAVGIVARATRLVGGRSRASGRVTVMTRAPDHPVVAAVVAGDVGDLAAAEADSRAAFGLAPARAVALLSGPGAPEYVAALRAALADDAGVSDRAALDGPLDPRAVEISERGDGTHVVTAADSTTLANSLRLVGRPAQRLRIEVDPYWL